MMTLSPSIPPKINGLTAKPNASLPSGNQIRFRGEDDPALQALIAKVKAHPIYIVYKMAIQDDRESSSQGIEIDGTKYLMTTEGKGTDIDIIFFPGKHPSGVGKVKMERVSRRIS
jgi:hypothetical protein